MLKVSLMGCGRIAKRHSELLGFDKINGASLVAVCDIDESKAKLIGKNFNVPYFTDIEKLLHQVDVDLVAVLTESGNHADHVVQVSKFRKHVLVEKPMALTLEDADRMIAACDEVGKKLFVVKQNRFNVPVVKLKEALNENRFGKLVLGTVRVRWCRPQEYYDQAAGRGSWAMDGGVLTNQASHHVDMLQWMMGDVESVFAKANTSLANIEAEDTAIVTLKFKSGALGIIEATTASRPKDLEGSISILGEKGSVVIGGFAVNKMEHWAFKEERKEDKTILEDFSVNPPNVYGFGHQAFYEFVVDCLVNNGPNLVDGLIGRKSLELINAIYESIETGKEVYLHFKPKFCRLGLN